MRFLGISGSLKATSTNTRLLSAMAALMPVDVQFILFDGIADLPHFSPDLDNETVTGAVHHWRSALRGADAVLICTPEYAYGMPGSLKNALDWTVSSGEFLNKPVAAMSASPNATGGARAHSSLLSTLTALSASVVSDAMLIVPLVGTQLAANDQKQEPALTESLNRVIVAIRQAVILNGETFQSLR